MCWRWGGTAADAAVAIGFTLSVTYPSRASLGAGGACLAYSPAQTGAGGGVPEAILFTPVAPKTVLPQTDRPAAVPMLARGLFALHARYGRRPFETLIAPAEQAARFGVPVSRALVRDLQAVAGPLTADPNARAIFAPGGTLLSEGATLIQPDLGATLSQLRVAGVGDLYQGALLRQRVLTEAFTGRRRRHAHHRRIARRAAARASPTLITAWPRARPGRVPAAAGRWRPGRRCGVPGAPERGRSDLAGGARLGRIAVASTVAARRRR